MKFGFNLHYNFLFLILSFFFINFCTNPIKVGSKTQAGHRTVVCSVDDQSQIKALFASPVEKKLGIVSESKEFDLLKIINTRSTSKISLKKNVFNPAMGSSPILSPQAKSIATFEQSQIHVLNLTDSTKQTFNFNRDTCYQVKWNNSADFLTALFFNSTHYLIYQINVTANSSTLLYKDTQRKILLADYNSKEGILCFYGSPLHDGAGYYVYFYDFLSAKLDSISADSSIQALAISNDGRKVVLVQLLDAQNTNIKILDCFSKNIELQQIISGKLSFPYWNHDDSKILFSDGEEFYVIYSVKNSTYKSYPLGKYFDGTLLEKVWGNQSGQINCLGAVNINRLSILNENSKNPESLINIRQEKICSPVWSPDGKQIVYMQNDSVYLFTPVTQVLQKIQIPFTFNKPVRWGPKENWLSFIYADGNQNFLRLFNVTTHETKEMEIPVDKFISDFSWIPGTMIISFAFPQIPGIRFFNFNENALSNQMSSDIDILNLRWSANKQLIETIGNYAVIQGRSTLGIFFKSRNNVNWLLNLTLRVAAKFDWSYDGKSLYYSGANITEDKNIYLEQVIFTKN